MTRTEGVFLFLAAFFAILGVAVLLHRRAVRRQSERSGEEQRDRARHPASRSRYAVPPWHPETVSLCFTDDEVKALACLDAGTWPARAKVRQR